MFSPDLWNKSAADDAYTIDNSCRFEGSGPDYLAKNFSSGSPGTKWTWSCWVKRVKFGADQQPFDAYVDSSNRAHIGFSSADNLMFYSMGTGVTTFGRKTSAVYRDPSAWYHIVYKFDTTQSETSRFKIYVNGVEQTTVGLGEGGVSDWPGASDTSVMTDDCQHAIAVYSGNFTSSPSSFYLAEMYFIDGTAYDADDFGELDSDTNQWKPIDASGLTFGTNGFYQKYAVTELANSFTDSAEGHTIEVQGNTHTDTAIKKFGTASAQFDGTGDALSITGTPVGSGTGDWTVEFWFYKEDSTTSKYFWDMRNSSFPYGGSPAAPYLYFDASASAVTTLNCGMSDGSATSIGSLSISNDAWHHIATTRYGTTYTVWVDGSSVHTATDAASLSASVDWMIGGRYSDADYFTGYVDEFRVSNTARYTGNFTPSTTAFTDDSNTKLLMHMDGANDGTVFTDSSTVAKHVITAVGNATNTRAVRKIGDSSIAFDGTGDYLSTLDSPDWDFGSGEFTLEFFTRFNTGFGNNVFMTHSFDPSGSESWKLFRETSTLKFAYTVSSSATELSFSWTPSADTWYYVALSRDGSGDIRAYIDGAQIGVTTAANVTIDDTTSLLRIGAQTISSTTSAVLDGYLDEIRISDTARYTGTTHTVPTTEFTADANTKLLIHSDWTGGLGADSSGNYNTFTPTNLVATDQMIDTPTNNFATYNPLLKSYLATTFTEGNLVARAGSGWVAVPSTFSVASGKWYMEFVPTTTNSRFYVVGDNSSKFFDDGINPQEGDSAIGYHSDGNKSIDNTATSYGATWVSGDIIAIALNMDDSEVTFYKNNATQGTISFSGNITSASSVIPFALGAWYGDTNTYANFGADSSFAGQKTAQGNQDGNEKGDFYYEPPSGFLALCSDNLPDPEIALPGDYFNTILWTGDDSIDPRAFTGVGFQPDLVWDKIRSAGYGHHLWDSVRGVEENLASDSTAAEVTQNTSGYVTTFGSDGFTYTDGTTNNYNFGINAETYVAWNWKAGGAPTADNSAGAGATPTAGSVKIDGSNLGSALAGSIAATRLSANTTSGMSIVQYTGTGSAATIAHGLGVKPALIIIKKTNGSDDWIIWQKDLHGDSTLNALKMTGASYVSSSTFWNSTDPNTSVFNVGTNGATGAANEFIAYVFAEIPGFSKVGNYVVNTSSATTNNGNFLYTGFKPAFFLNKMSDGPDGAGGWFLYDNKRPAYNREDMYLVPNENYAENAASEGWDFLSNGIKLRADFNANTHIYMAFAESPFKYSNAR